MDLISNLVDVHEGSGGVSEHVLVADGEDGVLPVDGHEAGVRLQDDVRMSVLLVSGNQRSVHFAQVIQMLSYTHFTVIPIHQIKNRGMGRHILPIIY